MKGLFARRIALFAAVALFGFSATVYAACQDRWCTKNYNQCLADGRADGTLTNAEFQKCFDEWSNCLLANGCQAP
ncbi:hypothetical protein [Lysobacter enzymogenes]|uniref:EF-hand domain-containing protein n=1 Tax=Lysobacter enzymogenes TaxID=69 RepID=A0AAU9AJY4_LYSEN|nr:hypothetical protein [Lysobacter enzymogenes]BAV97083.1 hypothetical protein LEN_1596 [Lysobacter enzymogenes]